MGLKTEVRYNENEEPIVLSKSLMDLLLKQDNPSDLISLYLFLYYTAKWQKTNQVKATVSYIAKGLKWSEQRVRKTKKQLTNLNLIEDIKSRDEKNRITGHYLYIRFIWGNEKVENVVNNPTPKETHPVDFPHYGNGYTMENLHPNALSVNNKNALSVNNKNNNILQKNFAAQSIDIIEKNEKEKNKKKTLSSSLDEKETFTHENFTPNRQKGNNEKELIDKSGVAEKNKKEEALNNKGLKEAKLQNKGVIPDKQKSKEKIPEEVKEIRELILRRWIVWYEQETELEFKDYGKLRKVALPFAKYIYEVKDQRGWDNEIIRDFIDHAILMHLLGDNKIEPAWIFSQPSITHANINKLNEKDPWLYAKINTYISRRKNEEEEDG